MRMRGEVKHDNVMYVKKTSRPMWGGALLIIAGLLNIGSGIGVTVALEAIEDFFDFTGVVFAGGPMIFIGAVTVIGGIATLMRRVWWLAIVGGILGVLPSPGWIFGVPGLILASVSKPEFDYREVLAEEREMMAERAAMPETARSVPQMQSYLQGMAYPTTKHKIASFAKSNGVPEEVMLYINRLPDREYHNPEEVEEEFRKIR